MLQGFLIGVPVLLVLAVVLNGLTLRILKPVRAPVDRTPETLGLDFEELSFSSDGRTLRGWWLRSEGVGAEASPMVLMAHGWGANSGTVLPLGAVFQDAGFDTMLFDFRHHGRSDDARRVTVFDYSDDLVAAVEHARREYPDRAIVLVGHSMGGAASVMAAADGLAVDGVLLVAAPASFVDVTARYLGPGFVGFGLLMLTAPFFWLHVRRWFSEVSPERHISRIRATVSIVHGDRDQRVPMDHPHRLARDIGVEPVVLEDTGHRDILQNPKLHAHAVQFVRSLVSRN